MSSDSTNVDVGQAAASTTGTRTGIMDDKGRDRGRATETADELEVPRQNISMDKPESKTALIYKPFKASVCELFKTVINANLENLRGTQGKRCVLVLPTINDFAHRGLKHVMLTFPGLETLEVRTPSEPMRLGIYDKLCFTRSSRNLTLTQIIADAKMKSTNHARTTDGRGRAPDRFMYVPPPLRTQRANLAVGIQYRGWRWSVVKQPEPDLFWTELSKNQIEQLQNLAGSSVDIVKPTWEDIGFDIQLTVARERVSHMVEVYNSDFPMGCDVKKSIGFYLPNHDNYNAYRIDQHHALLVFPEDTGPEICTEILWKHVSRFRPVRVASKATKMKVLNNADAIITPGSRGQSSVLVANRMIRKSLGLASQ